MSSFKKIRLLISLTNFAVKVYVGDENRTLRNQMHIYLSNETKINPNPTIALEILKYSFDIYDLDDLQKKSL